jgi:hypothetical protein
MRWRPTFISEVSRTLEQLGMKICSVCGSADSLDISPFPVILVDCRAPSSAAMPLDGAEGDEMIFAIRAECLICGHLSLFNSEKYRNGDEKILVGERNDLDEIPRGE